MGDEPRERYPVYPFARKVLKWSVPDPEAAAGEPEARKQAFRQVRDQMRNKVEKLVETMNQADSVRANAYTAAA